MANTIKIGDFDVDVIKVGSADCKVYLGDDLLWPQYTPTSFKVREQYIQGVYEDYEVPCDTSTTLTSGETQRGAMFYQSVVSAEVGDCVTELAGDCFRNFTALSSITLSDNITIVGTYLFYGCMRLVDVKLPSGLTSFPNHMFRSCSGLTNIDIPSGLTYVGQSAFNGCSSLSSVTLPASVTQIDYASFYGCSGLTSMTFYSTTPPKLSDTSTTLAYTNDCPIYVPQSAVETYKSANNWSYYSSRIQAIPT